LFSKQFDTPFTLSIFTISVHQDFDFVHLRVVRGSIWYRDAVGTFRIMGADPKLRPPKRARFLWRSDIKIWKTIAHNEIMSTKRKACLPKVGNQSSKKGRPPQTYSIDDAVKMVSDSFENGGESMPCSE
jgi:hypothetical protein